MSQLNLKGPTTYEVSYRSLVVQALAEFRREWQKTANGESLIEVEVPVGLILADIAKRIELNTQERYAMLGSKLINEVDCFLEERIGINLPA